MSKQATMVISTVLVLFLLCPVFTRAARPAPQLHVSNSSTGDADEVDDELCKGVVGDEECRMMRRELAAHLDYIYTQKKKT